MNSSLYLGLPDSFWSDLCIEVEEIFYEDKIGQIILGVYPSGYRLFGLDYYHAEVICLYIDSSEDILNPLNNKTIKITKETSNASINFINLWTWISNFKNPKGFEQLIPCFGKVLYQEDSIAGIIDIVYEFLNNNIIYCKYNNVLNLRITYLFNKTKKFIPNINRDWGPVSSILTNSQYFNRLDLEIIKSLIKGEKLPKKVYGCYSEFLNKEIEKHWGNYNEAKQLKKEKEYLKEIGEVTSRFYRSII